MKLTSAIIVDDCEDLEITQEGLVEAKRKIQATIEKRTKPKPEFVPTPPIIWEPTEPSFEPWFFVMFICLLGIFLILGIIKV